MQHGQHKGYTMTDDDIKEFCKQTRYFADPVISFDTPPEQRLDEAMQINPDAIIAHVESMLRLTAGDLRRRDGEAFVQCAGSDVSIIDLAKIQFKKQRRSKGKRND